MGNLSFIVPAIKTEDYNLEKIKSLLIDKFPDFIIDFNEEYSDLTIRVRNPKRDHYDFIMSMYFNQDCYILNYDEDIKYLENEKGYDTTILVEELKELKKLNPDLDCVIQTTYGYYNDLKNDVDFFLRDYFKGYIFDEGIHPEFIGPSYVRKIKQKKTLWERIFNFTI